MNEIHSMVTPTERLRWKVPLDADHPLAGQPGGHRIVDPVTGEVTAPGSRLYHSELDDVIENANTIDELYDGVHQLRERWRIPEDLLPPRK